MSGARLLGHPSCGASDSYPLSDGIFALALKDVRRTLRPSSRR